MKRIIGRLGYMLIVLIVSSIAVFYAIRLSGGDATAAALPGSATEEFRQEFRASIGLDRPIYLQYFAYMGKILRGDPGRSITNNASLIEMLKTHGKNSLILGGAAFALVFVSLVLESSFMFMHPIELSTLDRFGRDLSYWRASYLFFSIYKLII